MHEFLIGIGTFGVVVIHLGVLCFSTLVQFCQVWHVQAINAEKVVQVPLSKILVAFFGLGPAIYTARQEEMVISLFLCLIFGQAIGSWIRMRMTTGRWK